MCGRFTNRLTWREIVALYRLSVPGTPERNLPARYNICPTDTIDAVIEREGRRELVPMRWGLVPSWWKKKAGRLNPGLSVLDLAHARRERYCCGDWRSTAVRST